MYPVGAPCFTLGSLPFRLALLASLHFGIFFLWDQRSAQTRPASFTGAADIDGAVRQGRFTGHSVQLQPVRRTSAGHLGGGARICHKKVRYRLAAGHGAPSLRSRRTGGGLSASSAVATLFLHSAATEALRHAQDKVCVNGPDTHPVYAFLKAETHTNKVQRLPNPPAADPDNLCCGSRLLAQRCP